MYLSFWNVYVSCDSYEVQINIEKSFPLASMEKDLERPDFTFQQSSLEKFIFYQSYITQEPLQFLNYEEHNGLLIQETF